MNHQISGLSGRHPISRIALAAGLLGMILSALASASAQAGVDPMREARPAPRFQGIPAVAPPKGGAIAVSRGATTRAGASSVRGGISVPNLPRVRAVTCVRQCISAHKATPGAVVRVTGGYLNGVVKVVFRSRKRWIGKKWKARTAGAVRAVVPKRAVDGRVFVVDRFGSRSNRSPRELAVGPVNKIPREVFPVRGRVNYGSSGSRFGAGRSGHIHQGQDVAAACGTTLVSARRGRVTWNGYQGSGAGNYLVIKNAGTNTSFVYMHMLKRSRLRVGAMVGAGTPIGKVGNTGRSFGCHLHFEYWVGPWQAGGKPIDPLRYLKSLNRN